GRRMEVAVAEHRRAAEVSARRLAVAAGCSWAEAAAEAECSTRLQAAAGCPAGPRKVLPPPGNGGLNLIFAYPENAVIGDTVRLMANSRLPRRSEEVSSPLATSSRRR